MVRLGLFIVRFDAFSDGCSYLLFNNLSMGRCLNASVEEGYLSKVPLDERHRFVEVLAGVWAFSSVVPRADVDVGDCNVDC